MKKILMGGAIVALVCLQMQSPSAKQNADGNLVAVSSASNDEIQAMFKAAANPTGDDVDSEFVGQVCGVAVIPGPKTGTAITMHVQNQVADTLDFLIIDPFGAFGKRALPIESIFGLTAPAGGTMTDLYPGAASGRGPVVIGLTSFNNGETATFSMDPDTYDNAAFGATVAQMNGTVVEAAYVGSGRRCVGKLAFKSTVNASVATLLQKSPTP